MRLSFPFLKRFLIVTRDLPFSNVRMFVLVEFSTIDDRPLISIYALENSEEHFDVQLDC